MTSMFVGIYISCSTGLVESDSVGQSGDAPPFALWIQLPDCWSTELRPLEKGLASWDVTLCLTLYLVFLQNFNAYHTCPEKVMIQHGQIYSKLWLLMCMKYTSQTSFLDVWSGSPHFFSLKIGWCRAWPSIWEHGREKNVTNRVYLSLIRDNKWVWCMETQIL